MSGNNKLSMSSDNKVIGWIVSVIVHLLVVLLVLFYPSYTREKPADAYEGVLVSFGLPIESAGEESAEMPTQELEEEEEKMETVDVKETQEEEDVKAELVEEESQLTIEQKEEVKPVDREKTIPKEEEVDPQDQLDKAKDEFSKLFSKGNSSEKKSSSGDPLGEPDAEALEGISKGQGKVGGGLDERGILFEPEIIEQSQKSGKVVIKVCVNKTGKVISAKYTQRNSTTTDRELVEIAEISALKYRFLPSEFEEQCGTIAITFIVR